MLRQIFSIALVAQLVERVTSMRAISRGPEFNSQREHLISFCLFLSSTGFVVVDLEWRKAILKWFPF
jgi:hypothetical protein